MNAFVEVEVELAVDDLPEVWIAIELGADRNAVSAVAAVGRFILGGIGLEGVEVGFAGEAIRCLSVNSGELGFAANGLAFRLISASAADAAADAAAAGLGVTRLLCYQALPAIRAKKLKLILRDFEPSPTPVSFVYRAGRSMPQKLRAFIDFVTPRMKSRLVFDP